MNRWISVLLEPDQLLAAARRRVARLQDADQMAYWNLTKALKSIPRYSPGKVAVEGWDFEYVDSASLLSAFEVIVVKRWNDFKSDKDDPVILDCGANIGISSIHYKHLFPQARITAFEPDARVCQALRRNLAANGAADVETVEAAVWTSNGRHQFFSEGADANRLIDDRAEVSGLERLAPCGKSCIVDTVRLADFLARRPVDFIKLDIEGAEPDVVADCAERLARVQSIVIEFHLTNSKPKGIATTLTVLADAGFQVSIGSYGPWVDLIRRPNVTSQPRIEFDQNLLICAWR
jgi:FkbM family methyltransferase